jgi:hypothetical protein
MSAHIGNTGPMLASPRCRAKTRSGGSCRSPAVHGKKRCRMHGGASSPHERSDMRGWTIPRMSLRLSGLRLLYDCVAECVNEPVVLDGYLTVFFHRVLEDEHSFTQDQHCLLVYDFRRAGVAALRVSTIRPKASSHLAQSARKCAVSSPCSLNACPSIVARSPVE